MVRWIAFDDDTADALVGKFKRGAAEIREGDVLDSSLRHDEANILIYPSTSPERVLLARVRHSRPENAAEPMRPLTVQSVRPEPSPLLPRNRGGAAIQPRSKLQIQDSGDRAKRDCAERVWLKYFCVELV